MEHATSERRQAGNTVQIVIAIIGVLGVLGAAVIANFDKLFPKAANNSPGVETSGTKLSPATPDKCVISGRAFNRQTNAPLPGVSIDFYTYRPSSSNEDSRAVQRNAAITGPDGSFRAVCRGVAESDFPLRVVVSMSGASGSRFREHMPVKVELNDTRTDINLPVMPRE